MKIRYMIAITILSAVAGVQGAIVVGLGSGPNETATTFTYSNLGTTADFNGGAMNGATTPGENTISDAGGSFTITWTATAANNSTDAAAWSFGSSGATINAGGGNPGWGISGGTSGGNQLGSDGEAFLLTFNLTNLVIDIDHRLVFSVRANTSNESFRVYKRTGATNAVVVAAVASGAQVYTANITVDGLLEFAITDAGWDGGNANRLNSFSIDVVAKPPAPAANNDAMTMHLLSKAKVPVLRNDLNLDDLDYIELVTPPSSGTATLLADSILYEHTTGSPASDSLSYRLVALDGRTSEVATVSISLSTDVRIANTTLNVPPEPPVDGYSIVNAFPGLSFFLPLSITSPPGETDRLFVCEKMGTIQLVLDVDGTPSKVEFFDLAALLAARPNEAINTGSESGLLGLAFHPNYATNGYFYAFYSVDIAGQLHQRISRFSVSGNPDLADAASEQILIEQFDDAGNHNGGDLQFGPDGYLYVSVGDEGGGNDQWDNSQRITKDYFSGILRIDVDKLDGNLEPNPHPSIITNGFGNAYYSVPADNHWVGATNFNGDAISASDVITEFYAVGLRNPWRIHFDPLSGELYCADVGQNAREEVNIVTNGGNYGWAYFEASLGGPKAPAPPGFVHDSPIYEYSRGTGEFEGRSISGGVVYRGTTYSELIGKYVFGDYTSGNIWTLDNTGTNVSVERITGTSGPVGFGYDPSNGDVLIASINEGQVQRLVADAPVNDYPAVLSETGVFADLSDLSPNPGILYYEPNLAFWSDHAIKDRWFVIPNTTDTVSYAEDDPWTYPSGMVWIKHFEIETERGNPATRKRLETRLLVKNDDGTYGVSYRWNEAETEAYLVPAAGEQFTLSITNRGIPADQTWTIPGRSQCITCHLPNAGHALSFNTRQMNRDFPIGGFAGNQIATLRDAGYLTNAPIDVTGLPRHLRPDETEASLEARVRSYLAVNCANCHQSGGANPGNWDGRPELSLQNTALINGLLNNNGGDSSNRLVVPGDSGHSVLLSRIEASGGFARMPPLGSSELDQTAIDLVQDWINNELSQTFQTYAEWRLAIFGSTNSLAGDPSNDFDGDGRSNEFEWLTRTDPNNTNDFWRADLGADGLGGLELNFDWILNRVIEIEESTNLVDWTLLDDPANHGFPAGSSDPEIITFPAPDSPKGFFRFNIQE